MSLSQQVWATLRADILSGDLEQGVEVSQIALAQRLGVSRTPLREGLRRLEAEGLIETQPNGRIRIAEISVADVEQLYAMRILLESYAVFQSTPLMTPGDFDALAADLAAMDRSSAAQDVEKWEEPHRAFHARLVAHSGRRVVEQLRMMADNAQRYRRYYVSTEPRAWWHTAAEHRAIVEAMKAGDGLRAAHEMAQHMARTGLTVIALVDPRHEPAPIRAALTLLADSGGAGNVLRSPDDRRHSDGRS